MLRLGPIHVTVSGSGVSTSAGWRQARVATRPGRRGYRTRTPGSSLWRVTDRFTFGSRWRDAALCREYPDVNFFPGSAEARVPAEAVCARCVVADACLAYALADASLCGIWAGTSARERQRLRLHPVA
jgi:WhiB family redox-sensing transcriptional regulator